MQANSVDCLRKQLIGYVTKDALQLFLGTWKLVLKCKTLNESIFFILFLIASSREGLGILDFHVVSFCKWVVKIFFFLVLESTMSHRSFTLILQSKTSVGYYLHYTYCIIVNKSNILVKNWFLR